VTAYVTIRATADRDLDAIYAWISRDNPDAAARHIQRLVAAARRLAAFPERGTPRPEIGTGARSIPVGAYLILYKVEANSVDVVRIVHGARDVGGWVVE
jgi:toxin ParE1/3/4